MLCKLCAEAGKQFVMKLKRRKQTDLSNHIVKRSRSEGFKGHPKCGFCKQPRSRQARSSAPLKFHDDDALYTHLNQQHESCHVCKRLGKLCQYYRNRKTLFQYFKEKHFVCKEPECKDSFAVCR